MLWIPRLFGKRIVVTIHGLDWQRSKWGSFASTVIKFGERLASRYADEIIVLSDNMQQYFRNNYGRETVFISNGVSRPQKRKAEIITERWSLHKDEYILFLARLVPEKGVHYLIEAYKQLNTDKKLVISGCISHGDEYIESLLKRAGNNEKIIFTDFVGGKDREELFSNAYLFVLPSDVEGMAMGLLEAMSYGNCCLVSDIPENIEVVEDKAVIFKKGSIRDLNKKLQELLSEPANVSGYKSMASDFICEKYDWDRVVEQTVKVYYGKTGDEGTGDNN